MQSHTTEKPPSTNPRGSSDPEIISPDDVPCDSWRGWLIVAAASFSFFMYMGVVYSWGILQARMADELGYSLTTLTFVGSLATSCMVSLCMVVGRMVRELGYRKVALAGAVLLGLGEFLSSWLCGHLWALFITHGVVFGIGGGLTALPCTTAPLQWFKKHKGLATAVVYGAGSLGAAVIGVSATELIDKVGVEWTFRILGLMLWAICLPAACCIKQPLRSKLSVPKPQWHRWREPKFLVLVLGGALASFPVFIPPYFIPVFTKSIAASASLTIISLTIWNVSSAVGRLLAGFSADSVLGPINSIIISVALSGISCLCIWPFVTSGALLVFFAIMNGIGCGSFFSLFPLVVGASFGTSNIMGMLPMVWQTWMVGYLLGTPIAASLYSLAGRDAHVSSYRPAAYYAGALSIASMFCMVVLRLWTTKRIMKRV